MSQHNRFVLDCKDNEPDVLFVGDSIVQLMYQYEIMARAFVPTSCTEFWNWRRYNKTYFMQTKGWRTEEY